MADEITSSVTLSSVNGNETEDFTVTGAKLDAASVDGIDAIQQVGTSEETVDFGDVALPAKAAFVNRDPTNFIELGFATGVYPIRLYPGDPQTFLIASGVTVYVKADTGACRMKKAAFPVSP